MKGAQNMETLEGLPDRNEIISSLPHELSDDLLDKLINKSNVAERGLLFLKIAGTEIGETFTEEQWIDVCFKADLSLLFERLRRRNLVQISDRKDWLSPFDMNVLVHLPEDSIDGLLSLAK